MTWHPHVTVAAVIEHNNKFLLVHEHADEGPVYNQPAGHLEQNESLIDAVIRETREETGWEVEPTALLGIRQYTSPANGFTYIRHSFIARPIRQLPQANLDAAIIEPIWMSQDDAKKLHLHLRSPLVLHDIEAYLAGESYPLSLIFTYNKELK